MSMANGTAQADSAIATYRVLRELGRRTQRSYAAARGDGSLVVLHRFTRDPKADAEVVSAEDMAILLRDARCLAKNWHPNIARVRHVDLAIDTLDIATELVEGVTLEELIALASERRGHPDEPVLSHAILARIFLDVLGGLSALHSLRDGINAPLSAFHGELCPANVVVGKDGVARIVSVFRPRPVTITARSEALGYASPETIAAEIEQDARVDIYAAGVMLWEALTERRLYVDTSPSRIAQRQREEDIPAPNARLADVAMRALAFDPALRFRTAQDMAANIRALAGTVAQGSLVAQLVNELAGERIRARRAELDPSGRHRSLLPPPARSGTHARAQAKTVEAKTDFIETPSVAPPVAPSSGAPRASRSASGEGRFAVPSAPDVETSYAPRPLAARPSQRPPFPARALPLQTADTSSSLPPPSDDDDLPGPRESTPDDAYLDQLAAAIRAHGQTPRVPCELDVADLVEDDEDPEGNALTMARQVKLSELAITPTPPAPVVPPPVASVRQPSTRTPFVVDLIPDVVVATSPESNPFASRSRRAVPLAILAAAAVLLLAIGVTVLTRSSESASPEGTTTVATDREPPSTLVVAPPPAVDSVPAAASGAAAAPSGAPSARTPAPPHGPRPPAKKQPRSVYDPAAY